MMKETKDILFIHIPKTGGTSIRASKFLAHQRDFLWNIPQYLSPPVRTHQPIFILEKYNNLADYFIFTVVRNPFRRAYSYYKYYMRITGINLSLKDFLIYVQTKNKSIDQLKHLEVINFNIRLPFLPFTQSFYLFDSDGNMRINKIYRHENLDELENDFNITLPKLNTGYYNNTEYQKAYTTEIVDLVKHIYAEDFTNLNYSTEFT